MLSWSELTWSISEHIVLLQPSAMPSKTAAQLQRLIHHQDLLPEVAMVS